MSPLIDHSVFSELQAAAGADFVIELVDTFCEEAPPMLADLRDALAAGAADRFRRTAHSLKTNANTFGAMALGLRARDLEIGGLPPDAGPLDALESDFTAVAAALKALARG